MSRTQVRVVLILIALILVMAAILSGVLTYWGSAGGLPTSAPEDGEAGRMLMGSWQRGALVLPVLLGHFGFG